MYITFFFHFFKYSFLHVLRLCSSTCSETFCVSYCWILFGVSLAERSSGILSGDLLDEGQRDLSLGVLETPLTTEIRVCWGHMDHAHFDIVVVLGRMGGVLGILVVVVAVFWWDGDVQKTYDILHSSWISPKQDEP